MLQRQKKHRCSNLYLFFLVFLILSSFFWGTTSFQLTKKANDINRFLMRVLVIKTLHKNSSGFEIIQYFSGDKTKLPSSFPPQHNWKKIHTNTFLLWLSETFYKISCLSLCWSVRMKKTCTKLETSQNALSDLLMKSFWGTKGIYSPP